MNLERMKNFASTQSQLEQPAPRFLPPSTPEKVGPDCKRSVNKRRPSHRCIGLGRGWLARGLRRVLKLLQFPHCIRQVLLADDVVPVEHATGLVPGDHHRNPLLNARADKSPLMNPSPVDVVGSTETAYQGLCALETAMGGAKS